jgi:hypothetical protein
MKRLNLYRVMIVVVLSALLMLTSSAHAAPHATYELVKSYVGSTDGGADNAETAVAHHRSLVLP